MVYRRFSYGCTVSVRLSYGFRTAFVYGFRTAFVRFSYGSRTAFVRLSYGFRTVFGLSYGFRMAFVRFSYGFRTVLVRAPFTSQVSDVRFRTVSYLSYGFCTAYPVSIGEPYFPPASPHVPSRQRASGRFRLERLGLGVCAWSGLELVLSLPAVLCCSGLVLVFSVYPGNV